MGDLIGAHVRYDDLPAAFAIGQVLANAKYDEPNHAASHAHTYRTLRL